MFVDAEEGPKAESLDRTGVLRITTMEKLSAFDLNVVNKLFKESSAEAL